jgi:hypothetical protein
MSTAHILLLCVGGPCAVLASAFAASYFITRSQRRSQPGPAATPGSAMSPWPQANLDTIKDATRRRAIRGWGTSAASGLAAGEIGIGDAGGGDAGGDSH